MCRKWENTWLKIETSQFPKEKVRGRCKLIMLFLPCTDDLPARLRSRVCLFTHYTIAYLVIMLPMDTEALQEDLNELAALEDST